MATDTGWVIAGAASDPSGDWNNEANITASDNTWTVSVVAGSGETGALVAHTFGLSVPAYATILGVEIRAEARVTSSACDITYWNVGESDATLGTAKVVSTRLTTSDANYDVGGAADLWGLSLTPAKVNASTFQVRMKATEVVYAGAEVDAMWVKVYYDGDISFASSVGSFTLSGVAAAFSLARLLISSVGSFALSGVAAIFWTGPGLLITAGSYALSTVTDPVLAWLKRVVSAVATTYDVKAKLTKTRSNDPKLGD